MKNQKHRVVEQSFTLVNGRFDLGQGRKTLSREALYRPAVRCDAQVSADFSLNGER